MQRVEPGREPEPGSGAAVDRAAAAEQLQVGHLREWVRCIVAPLPPLLAVRYIMELIFGGRLCRNQWTTMFASRSTNIGSDLPLWAVQDDDTPGVSTVTTFMGGWTTAYAKQYDLGKLWWCSPAIERLEAEVID